MGAIADHIGRGDLVSALVTGVTQIPPGTLGTVVSKSRTGDTVRFEFLHGTALDCAASDYFEVRWVRSRKEWDSMTKIPPSQAGSTGGV